MIQKPSSYANLFFLLLHTSMAQTCYGPNKIAEPDHVPCNSSAEHSHCCKPGDYCLDNGLCYDSAFTLSQWSCTDPSWTSPPCFQECKAAKTPVPITPTGRLDALGPNKRSFCCDANAFDQKSGNCTSFGQQSQPFTVPFGRVITDRRTGSIEVFNSTHTNTASWENATATTSSSLDVTAGATAKETAIGMGVGIPLALALIGVSFLLWRERRRGRELEERNRDMQQFVKEELVRRQGGGLYMKAFGGTSPGRVFSLEGGGARG
ncbi:hypothetical protein BCR34DRAFT_153291 [Clohesyomyces aquaticus]|uniref:Mid2 domain-containing protein n=1 Tax=Clohesyomyces aquaticus TaxID=1231657 RepID=A0A1Y2A1B7_9PLEO|nr:hypothetical protein BCR34DRAFT_153291 [Clohesyomyces aquaticus]